MLDRQLGYIPYFNRESCDLDEFKELTSQNLAADDVPYAVSVEKNVPVYGMGALEPVLVDTSDRRALMAALANRRVS